MKCWACGSYAPCPIPPSTTTTPTTMATSHGANPSPTQATTTPQQSHTQARHNGQERLEMDKPALTLIRCPKCPVGNATWTLNTDADRWCNDHGPILENAK